MIMALYLRLSKEDGDMVDESNSITNQRYILRRFVEQRPEFDSYEIKEYIDDGFSGKNFERPGVQNLLEDVKSGKVHGIVVKDFSRFGRNHIEVGNYIEKIFPLLDIRFIAVNNSFDSKDYIGTTPDMDVAFENLMYDYFSEENSVKIKNDLMGRRMRGNYLATFAAFGYKKSPSDHNRIIVNEEAAAIVRIIFEKYAEYGVKTEVARYLNRQGIPTPQIYAMKNGCSYQWKYHEEKKLWNGSIVGRILKNELYVGNTVFHKKETAEIGSRKTKCLPREEWKVCEGTHEPIISKELFELVNNKDFKKQNIAILTEKEDKGLLDKTIYCEGEKRRRGSMDSPIKGFVKCGGCKHNMQRRSRLNVSYYCRYYYEAKSKECCPENIKETELLGIVLSAIKHQAIMEGEADRLQELYRLQLRDRMKENQEGKKQFQEKIQELTDKNYLLYERYAKGEINVDQFMQAKENNNKLIEAYKTELQAYQSEETISLEEKPCSLNLLEGKENLTELTKELVRQLIDAIYVYSSKRIEIVFKFQDESYVSDRKHSGAVV
ncbi:MAG: recombinase family protein [Lachnospiraceae bacterium]|jgi:DNA invertase Pin-like site-specific DNA recombinase|nr:recombinase family protein [Lachnospiraceae bacterium]